MRPFFIIRYWLSSQGENITTEEKYMKIKNIINKEKLLVFFFLFTFFRVLKQKRMCENLLIMEERWDHNWDRFCQSLFSFGMFVFFLLGFLILSWSRAAGPIRPGLYSNHMHTFVSFSDFNKILDIFPSIKFLLYFLLLIWNWSL